MRLIDADALVEKMEEWLDYLRWEYGEDHDYTDGYKEGYIAVEEAPTVERPRGEWIKTFRCKGEDINTGTILSLYYYDCPKCKYRTGNQGKEFYFCPKCGADMRGEEG